MRHIGFSFLHSSITLTSFNVIYIYQAIDTISYTTVNIFITLLLKHVKQNHRGCAYCVLCKSDLQITIDAWNQLKKTKCNLGITLLLYIGITSDVWNCQITLNSEKNVKFKFMYYCNMLTKIWNKPGLIFACMFFVFCFCFALFCLFVYFLFFTHLFWEQFIPYKVLYFFWSIWMLS